MNRDAPAILSGAGGAAAARERLAALAAASIRTQINDRADDLTRIAAAACIAMRRDARETALRDLA
ncbi:MAG: hypothetical protein HXY28_13060, partial [Hydrogenophilaceae bacterium]|nr:hypothetical protein [Hydrogenophilaceae bacterium]